MSFGCSIIQLEKFLNIKRFQKEYLILKGLGLKNSKMIYKHYSKSYSQTLLKKWPTTVTQKMTHNCYSKIDPQTLLKKLAHNRYSNTDPQTLPKNLSANVTQKLVHNCH